MTGTEINSKKIEFQFLHGARLVTAPARAEIHYRLGRWSEYSFFGNFMQTFFI